MEELSKELEKQILDLLTEDKVIEAVILVNKQLNCGLKVAKNTVDKYRDMNAFNNLLSKVISTPPKSK